MVQAEVFHCRTAMLGAAGILIPEVGPAAFIHYMYIYMCV